ncbi:MAG: hypothetical protein ACM3JJ_07185 [Hyphomicrobiales bacterium]
MKQPLPLLFLAVLATATPATAQYIFLDTNGDGQCTAADVPDYGDATADVWLDTAHSADGSPVSCSTGEALSISAYDVVLQSNVYGSESFSFRGWTNAIAQFTQEVGTAQEGAYFWVGYTSSNAQTFLPPGKYKLGSLAYTRGGTGCLWIYPAASATISGSAHETDFFSQCLGSNLDYVIRLGADFNDLCAIGSICDDVQQTTWGKIKDIYRNR